MSIYKFLYDSSNDYDLGYRKVRLTETKKRLRVDIEKQKPMCIKYFHGTPPQVNELLITGTGKSKKIYYYVAERLGDRDSLDGEAYRICKPQKNRVMYPDGKSRIVCNKQKTYIQAIKIVPLTIEEVNNMNDSRYRTWREIKMLKQATDLVLSEVTQNLPMYYTHGICNDSLKKDYVNKNLIQYFENGEYIDHLDELFKEINKIRESLHGIKYYKELKTNLNELYKKYIRDFSSSIDKTQKYSNKSILIFNEISSFDFNHLMEKEPLFILRKEFIIPTMFQILHGLAALNVKYSIVHFDLHLSNVLVTQVDITEKKYWHYRVNKIDYYIPNQGYLFKVWDFGRANYIDYDNRNDIKTKIIKQFQRFFIFDEQNYSKQLNKTFKKATFRRYLYSFDVYRFFSAYYEKLVESVADFTSRPSKTKSKNLSTNITSAPTSTGRVSSAISKPLHTLSSSQIHKLSELETMKKIIDLAFHDIMQNMVNSRLRTHEYKGNPINILQQSYFAKYTIPPVDPENNIINYGHPYTI